VFRGQNLEIAKNTILLDKQTTREQEAIEIDTNRYCSNELLLITYLLINTILYSTVFIMESRFPTDGSAVLVPSGVFGPGIQVDEQMDCKL
jgi:hypothetical protein